MGLSRIAEARIREAMAEGQFDNLPGAGRPLDLEEYFSAPAELRMAFSILRNANCAPVEVELLKEVARLEREIGETTDTPRKLTLQRALTSRQLHLAVLLEHRSRRKR